MFNVVSEGLDNFAKRVLSHFLQKGLDRTVYEILNLDVNDFDLVSSDDRGDFLRLSFSAEIIDKDFLDGVWFT